MKPQINCIHILSQTFCACCSGKGLGKNEAGTTTHVKIVKKDDAMGIGFKAAQVRVY
jgi:hypothetical protein